MISTGTWDKELFTKDLIQGSNLKNAWKYSTHVQFALKRIISMAVAYQRSNRLHTVIIFSKYIAKIKLYMSLCNSLWGSVNHAVAPFTDVV